MGSAIGPMEDPELDGHNAVDVAVCGFSLKFPEDVLSAEGFWEMMMEKRCATSEFPSDRINAGGFYTKKNRLNTMPVKGGHFISDDLSAFDADFFSISPAEAAAMDPMQRWLLETSYHALENAGMSIETIRGSSTAVFTGSFNLDHILHQGRDVEDNNIYASVGGGLSMLANRLSWFFDLRGPSIGLDSACSSTAMAIDIACQSLRSGACDMALVAGSNLANAPESYVWMSNLNFLSPDSRCYSFDHRANGYARGEGFGVVILKRVEDAIRDDNTIRAVIRSTGSNEDGRTPGITQPNRKAQQQLIERTYRKAGLLMKHTRFFEAHGTGTSIGDPREAQAIGHAFQESRSAGDPLYVGAVKSNLGHLEGASGLAALFKTVLVLEKGIIPPNTNFECLNPKIDADFLNLKFPIAPVYWPSPGLRRASINSFGYGGANSHIVVDDAYNYLRIRALRGRHHTANTLPGSTKISSTAAYNGVAKDRHNESLKLLVWTAADRDGISRLARAYQEWYHNTCRVEVAENDSLLTNLAHTLHNHRSKFQWRSFAVLGSNTELSDLQSRITFPTQAYEDKTRIGFIFTGQGAQWFGMGRELMTFKSFESEIESASEYLQTLGCRWIARDELAKSRDDTNIHEAEYSQPLCTILQVALVNLLRRFGIEPSAVVGHSSGEIAAAYAGGYLSRESAWKLAYFRGLCSTRLIITPSSKEKGAMMAIGMSEEQAIDLLTNAQLASSSFGISVACVNGPDNVTLAGEEALIDELKSQLDGRGIFARKLRVPLAYHSRQMNVVAPEFVSLVGSLCTQAKRARPTVPMISSVTGEAIEAAHLIDPNYWALNMTSRVKFLQAMKKLCIQSEASLVKKIDRSHLSASTIHHLLEIGPHAALEGPIKSILQTIPRNHAVSYTTLLRRDRSAMETVLQAMGNFFTMGIPIDSKAVNNPREVGGSESLLLDLPGYPFDHSQRHWHESRLSRNYRLRRFAPSELLGTQTRDWNPSEPRWRHFIRKSEMPWVEHHVVHRRVLYPAAGMLVMAVEAAKQLTGSVCPVEGYTLRDVCIEAPMDLTENSSLEVQTSLRPMESTQDTSANDQVFEFTIYSVVGDEWSTHCRGFVSVHLGLQSDDWEHKMAKAQRQRTSESYAALSTKCETPADSRCVYQFLERYGYSYGPSFQNARCQRWSSKHNAATAEISLFHSTEEPHVIHPVSLDAIFHLFLTALSSGGSKPINTSVPYKIGCLWLSDSNLHWPDYESVTATASIKKATSRGFICDGAAMDNSASPELRLWYRDFELRTVAEISTEGLQLPNPEQFCMNVDCKVALDMMELDETAAMLNIIHPAEHYAPGFFEALRHLVEISLARLNHSMCVCELDGLESWTKRYWIWTQHHLTARNIQWSEDVEAQFEKLCHYLKDQNPIGRLYVELAIHLAEILRGKINALELLMQTGILKDYYEELSTYRCAKQAASYLDLLAHQRPGLKILEVGGGTASATRNLIRVLDSGHVDCPGSLRCSRYDFTDVSPYFLDKARDEFSHFTTQMTFRTLDVTEGFDEQGFEEGTYDVVVADNVLHVSSNLTETMRCVRRALKPGGKLITHEAFKADGWTAGFVFGVFPGWWLGTQDNRPLSPNISKESWDAILRETGFSGVDLAFRDFEDDTAHHFGWIVSTSTSESLQASMQPGVAPREPSLALIVVDDTSKQQLDLAEQLRDSLQYQFGTQSHISDLASMSEIASNNVSKAFTILLTDFGLPWLNLACEKSWAQLQRLVQNTRQLLWVSSGGGHSAPPEHAMLDGLTRTLRYEDHRLHLVTVALDADGERAGHLRHLTKVISKMAARAPGQSYEQEFVEIDSRLHVRRLVDAEILRQDMNARLLTYETVALRPGAGSAFQISMTNATGAKRDGLFYVCCPPLSDETHPGTVDIAVKAVSLTFRDRDCALGLVPNPQYGSYCSGHVIGSTSVTAGMHGEHVALENGDAVFAAQVGSFRSHVRAPESCVVKLPPSLSPAYACQTLPVIVTAYHALIEVGDVCVSDVVLVHNGASAIGGIALRLLADQGVEELWTTVTDQNQSQWIQDNLGIPEERILPQTWFDNQNMPMMSYIHKFDVVFQTNSQGRSPLLSLGCVASGGRLIVLEEGNYSPTGSKQSIRAHADVALHFVRSPAEGMTAPGDTSRVTLKSMRYAVSLGQSLLHQSTKIKANQLPANDLKQCLDTLHHIKQGDGIVVTLDQDTDTVQARTPRQRTYNLDPDATYVIAGGLGGLGRGIARWLVGCGARHLILLSRSGPRSDEAQQLLADMTARGVMVEAPRCDITDSLLLGKVLRECALRMPPVKGCIQASMVMTEAVFAKLGFQEWRSTVDSKVQASWNLHSELPSGLDFFVLLSSLTGILGRGSLAAYNAGNTYQDALARYRISCGERAAVLDLGAIPDVGYINEHAGGRFPDTQVEKYVVNPFKEVCALLEIICDPSSPTTRSLSACQAIIGARPPSRWKHLINVDATMDQPYWGHMHHIPTLAGSQLAADFAAGSRTAVDLAAQVATSSSLAEAAGITSEALAQQVSTQLKTAQDRLDAHRPMHTYGIDSLSAVELRNWVARVFSVDLPIFEILGKATFASAGLDIARQVLLQK